MEERSYRAARLLRALGHPLRFRIIELLSGQVLSSAQIGHLLERKQPTVSNSLSVLVKLDMVSYKRTGNRLVYRLKIRGATAILERARECVVKIETMGRLR